jgi:t-SNARE complex subunit (syntaxin)
MKLASNSGGLRQALTQRVTGKASKKWMYTYNDIMDKNEGIKTLEAAVAENLRLIKEVLAMVEKQGEMIDNILTNVEQARDYIVKAEQVLQEEKQIHKKSRKVNSSISIEIMLHYLSVAGNPGDNRRAHHHQGHPE